MKTRGYSFGAVILHWLLAVSILFLFAKSWWMMSLPWGEAVRGFPFQLHKNLGLTLILVVGLALHSLEAQSGKTTADDVRLDENGRHGRSYSALRVDSRRLRERLYVVVVQRLGHDLVVAHRTSQLGLRKRRA